MLSSHVPLFQQITIRVLYSTFLRFDYCRKEYPKEGIDILRTILHCVDDDDDAGSGGGGGNSLRDVLSDDDRWFMEEIVKLYDLANDDDDDDLRKQDDDGCKSLK